MAVAKIELLDGTKIELDGTIAEIAEFTRAHSQAHSPLAHAPPAAPLRPKRRVTIVKAASAEGAEPDGVDIARIVELIKECDEAEKIEEQVLNQRSALNRVLLPLYITGKYIDSNLGLSSGDVTKVTDQLGVKVAISAASRALSVHAKAYVTGDVVRKKGATVRYRLNRRGIQHFEGLLK